MDKQNLFHGNSKMKILNNENTENNYDTNIPVSFTIHNFKVSRNGIVVTKKECAANMHTLIGKPILVQYFNDGDKDRDHLGDHGECIVKNRDTGEDMIGCNTFAIGVFTDAHIDEIEINGKKEEWLIGDGVLWEDRYYNVCSLLKEWDSKGITINCSCEYIFRNFEVKDGIEYTKSPFVYEGHVILNSEEKDGYGIVDPAYSGSTLIAFNSAIKKDLEKINNEKQEERVIEGMENIFKKALNDISLGETRDLIFSALEKVMIAEEFNSMWLSTYNIFDDYFIYETYKDDAWRNYKISYKKDGDNIEVDYANKVELEYKAELVPKEEVKNSINQAVKEKDEEIVRLNSTIAKKDEEITSLTSQVGEKDKSLNSLTEELTKAKENEVSLSASVQELNETITSLNAYKEKMEEEESKRILNEVQNEYKEKFESFNSIEKFETEEIQQHIKDTLNPEKALNAKLALADALLECVPDTFRVNNSKQEKQKSYEPLKNVSNLGGTEKPRIKVTDIIS